MSRKIPDKQFALNIPHHQPHNWQVNTIYLFETAMSALLGFLLSFHYSQLFVTPASPTTDFTGQTIIVTGSSSGLGLEGARHYVRPKASLVIF